MKEELKKIILNWRVLLLLTFLLFSLISIKPQLLGNEGVIIRSVGINSSAAQAGMENPPTMVTPLAKEKIISIDRQKITSLNNYYAIVENLKENRTVRIETVSSTYTLLTKVNPEGKVDLGLKVSAAPLSNLRKGLDLEGGIRVLLKPAEKISADDLENTIANLKERLNVFGLSDVVVRPAADLQRNKFILIEIAGVTEGEVKNLLAKQGKFEAKIGNETVFLGGNEDITYVCRTADCSGIDPNIGCRQLDNDYACSFFFGITLSPKTAQRQAEITSKLMIVEGSYLSEELILFLDDSEVDRLRIVSGLKGRATTNIQITGSGTGRSETQALENTLQEMKRLQAILITGSLPVRLETVKLDTISPSLGKEFLNNIITILILTIFSVVTIIYLRYQKLKIVLPMAIILLSEIILILGFAALVGWNLDLAAIAGIIMVSGTGVDHLIVITDEAITGKGSIETNWKRRIKMAMFIMMGAYLTTVAGMLPLLWAGAGLLKGFAMTTIAGSSFGVFIARPAYAVIIDYLLKE